MEKYAMVKLKYDLPEDNLKKGMVGVVIEIFDAPVVGYEVEFTDEKGETIAEVALEPHQIELVNKPGK